MKLPGFFAIIAFAAGGLVAPAQDRVVIRGSVRAAQGEAPVAGARVWVLGRIRRDQPRAGLNEAITAADGNFEIQNVPRTQARMLSVAAPGFARGWAQLDPEGSSDGGGEIRVEIRLEPGRTFRGRVVDKKDGAAVAGAAVTADQLRAETDAEGQFALEGLESGADIPITVSAKGYQPSELTLTAADPAEAEVRVELEAGWKLAVRVVDDDGAPLKGLRVRARLPKAVAYSGLERADFSAVTGEDGVAVLSGFPEGHPVAPEVEAEGYIPSQGAVVMPSPAGADPSSPSGEVVLSKGRSAAVEVRDARGQPLPGSRVDLLPLVESLLDFGGFVEREVSAGAIRSARSGNDGRVAFDRLPAGAVTCEVRAVGFLPRLLLLRPGRTPAEPVVCDLQPDPHPPAKDLPWEKSVAEAFRRADETGLPILFSMSMDGERANDHLARAHFHDPEIVRVARELPVVLTNVFGKDGVPGPVGGTHSEVDGVCTRYGTFPCAAHQAAEPYVINEFFNGRRGFQVPRHLVVTRDGRTLMDRTFYLSERDLRWMMMRALRNERPEVAVRLAGERLGHLLAALKSPGSRTAIVDLVALINGGDEFAVALLGRLGDGGVSSDDRGRILEGILVPALHYPASALRPFLGDEDEDVRVLAIRKLASLAATDTDVQEALIPLLTDRDYDCARATRSILEASVDFVDRPAEGNRWRIVTSLLRAGRLSVGSASRTSGFEVRAVLGSGSSEARNEVLRILAKSARGEEDLINEVGRPGLHATHAIPALRALGLLARNQPPEDLSILADAYVDVVRPWARDECGLVREEVVRLLGTLPGAAAREAVVRALSDPALEVRSVAALALCRAGDLRGAATLLEALSDPLLQAEVRGALEAVYSKRAPATPSAWRSWLESQGFLPPEGGGR